MKRFQFVLLVLTISALISCATRSGEHASASTSSNASSAPDVSVTAETIVEFEKKAWELTKNKRVDDYRKIVVPEYRALYEGKIWNLDENIKNMQLGAIGSYSLSDTKVTFPVKDTAILTYRSDGVSAVNGKEEKYTVNCSSVWVNIGGQWKATLYTELSAPKK